MTHEHTIAETFVGAGGAHLGFKKAGFKSVFVNDIDSDTIATLIDNKVIEKEQCFTCPIEELTETQLKGMKVDVLQGIFSGRSSESV